MESAAAAVAAVVVVVVGVVVESVVAASCRTLLAGAYCIDCTFAEVDAAYQGGDVHRPVLVQRAFVAFLLAASLLAIVLAVAAVACTA